MAVLFYLESSIPRLNDIFLYYCAFLPALLFSEIQVDRQAVVQPVQSWYLLLGRLLSSTHRSGSQPPPALARHLLEPSTRRCALTQA